MRFEQNEFKLFFKIFKKSPTHILIKFSWIDTFFYHKHACLRNFPETENFGSGGLSDEGGGVLLGWG